MTILSYSGRQAFVNCTFLWSGQSKDRYRRVVSRGFYMYFDTVIKPYYETILIHSGAKFADSVIDIK